MTHSQNDLIVPDMRARIWFTKGDHRYSTESGTPESVATAAVHALFPPSLPVGQYQFATIVTADVPVRPNPNIIVVGSEETIAALTIAAVTRYAREYREISLTAACLLDYRDRDVLVEPVAFEEDQKIERLVARLYHQPAALEGKGPIPDVRALREAGITDATRCRNCLHWSPRDRAEAVAGACARPLHFWDEVVPVDEDSLPYSFEASGMFLDLHGADLITYADFFCGHFTKLEEKT